MEIHRFPSLNSVGRIRIGVSLDGGEILTVETVSRDEHLGNWQDNVRNNVDRIYVSLPYAGAGEHTVTFYGIDRYFAFSGFAIYTGERKQNNLAGAASRGDQRLPLPFDAEAFAKAFYGEIPLGPRPVEYARVERETDTLVAADFIGQEEEYAEKVDVSFYLEKRESAFPETDGNIRIDAATVLSDSASAHTEGAGWSYVSSESYGRSGLAMYLPALTQDTSEAGAGLHYRIACTGGAYTLWLLAMFGRKEESCFAVGVDGGRLDDSGIYNQGSLWRYEAEQIYRWVPAAKLELTEGQHDLVLYSLGAGLRIDRLYLTKGSERPPMDSEWNVR
jgi:hypothetical protein